jgi:hypothetical protein
MSDKEIHERFMCMVKRREGKRHESEVSRNIKRIRRTGIRSSTKAAPMV